MPQAQITINTVAGSNTDLPINTLVQLDNNNAGGEITYSWTLLDIPTGSSASLSNPAIQNPVFTPDVEGSYLIQLIVNVALPSEVQDVVVASVRQIKTRIRVPAAGESTEADSTEGWSVSVNSILQLVDSMRADPGLRVAQLNTSGLVANDIVRFSGVATLLSGLPGQQEIGQVIKVTGLDPEVESEDAYCLIGGVNGSGAPSLGELVYVRWAGLVGPLAGSPTVGDEVYVSDLGHLSLVSGTLTRSVGTVISVSGGFYWMEFTSITHEVANALVTAPVLTNGPPPALLVNAVDVTDLATPQPFVATAIIAPQTGAPISIKWDSGVSGTPGDKVAFPMVLRNSASADVTVAGVFAELLDATAGAEEAQLVFGIEDGSGTFQTAAELSSAGLVLPQSNPQNIEATNTSLTITAGGGDLIAESAGDNAILRANLAGVHAALEHVYSPTINKFYTEALRLEEGGKFYCQATYEDTTAPLTVRTVDYRFPIKVWTPVAITPGTSVSVPTFTPPNDSNGIVKLSVFAVDTANNDYIAEVWQRWRKVAGVVAFVDAAYFPQATFNTALPSAPWAITAGGADITITLQNPVAAARNIKLTAYIQILTNAWEV